PLRVRGSADAPVHPPPKGVLLDLGSLDRIASVDGVTGIARVEAGCSVAALEAAARRAGSTLGPLLPSVRAGSIGAWLAGPTRGERGIPGARRETAALSIAAVLADGHIAESRAAPRSATGPDLDHLALGGNGRLCVVAAAWIRLFPVAPALAGSWTCRDMAAALAGLERLCHDRLAPARARIVAGADSTRLAAAWEGLETAPMERDRAAAHARSGPGLGRDGRRVDLEEIDRSARRRGGSCPMTPAALRRAQELCEFCPKMCRFACPVSEATGREALTPWGKVSLAVLVGREPDAAAALAFAGCTGCHRCAVYCAHDNDVPSILYAARATAVRAGVAPQAWTELPARFSARGHGETTDLAAVH